MKRWLVVLAACGGGAGTGGDAAPTDGAIGGFDATNPQQGPMAGNPDGHCDVPAEAQLEDVSSPRTVVGTGTPGSCTGDAFVAAVAQGGVITFNCGPDPPTRRSPTRRSSPERSGPRSAFAAVLRRARTWFVTVRTRKLAATRGDARPAADRSPSGCRSVIRFVSWVWARCPSRRSVVVNKQSKKLPAKPFFTRFLEQQKLQEAAGGKPPLDHTLKFPSDSDETQV